MTKDQSDRLWDVVTKLSVAVTIALAGMILGHEMRLTKIEANRYTQKDALEREREVNARFEALTDQLGIIRTDVAVIRQILEKEEQ